MAAEYELGQLKNLIDAYLDHIMPVFAAQDGGVAAEAAAYSVKAGGKRIRPILLLASAVMCGAPLEEAMPYAGAIEMIHTYSLIHDDLPAMDNDLLRRGKPSCHAAYGEANAILAGDGILTFAFENLFQALLHDGSRGKVRAGLILARAAGFGGMVGGQCLDLADQKSGDQASQLRLIQKKKTGALIRAAVLAGVALVGVSELVEQALGRFADALGLSFQIKDDLLDVESTDSALGKTIGKDARDDKLTFVTLYGPAQAKQHFKSEMAKAKQALNEVSQMGYDVTVLLSIWRYLGGRVS